MKNKGSVVMLMLGSMLLSEAALADESRGEGPASSTTWSSSRTMRLRDVAEFPTWGQYTEHIGALLRHARSPTKSQVQEFARLQPCACKLQQVLVEMPHRISYFFELPSSRGGEQALLTVWRCKQDGASVDSRRARSNVKVGDSDGHLSMVRSLKDDGSVLKLSWITKPDANLATMVEFAVRTDDASDTHVDELARLIGMAAHQVNVVVQR